MPTVRTANVNMFVGLLILICVPGCSVGDQDPNSSNRADAPGWAALDYAQPASIPVVDSPSIPALPIEGYLVGAQDKAQIIRASRISAKACMARFGFEYSWVESTVDPNVYDNPANRSRRYGISSLDIATSYGYTLPPVKGNTFGTPSIEMSKAAARVFLGNSDPRTADAKSHGVTGLQIPKGGCSGEAKRVVGDGLNTPAAKDINMASFEVSLNDEQLKSVLSEWSACMRKSGYSYESPLEPLREREAETVTPVQIVKAQTDVRCKYATNLLGEWGAVEAEIQKAMIARKEEVLVREKRATEATLKNAANILSGRQG